MLANKRHEIIKKLLHENGSVDVASLCKILQVSDATVRKDLEQLESIGFLRKIHGGATINEDTEISEQAPQIDNIEKKRLVAKEASRLVSNNDCIFISSGTTCFLLAEYLVDVKNLTVVTNNASIIPVLAPYARNFLFLGGSIVSENGLFHSSFTVDTLPLEKIYVNKVFTGISGIDVDAGFTLNDPTTSVIIKHIFNMTKSLIVLADSTKFDNIGIYQLTPINKVNCVITDSKIPDEYKDLFFDNNIQVRIAFSL